MDAVLRVVAVVAGLFALFLYFRSIVRVLLINRRERDFIERGTRFMAVTIVHTMARSSGDYARTQRAQAWVLPFFIFFSVMSWFLLVQIAFTCILWGLQLEAGWAPAFSSSGSALSTLGFKTPPSLWGEYLAIYEAAIGLAVVILLFTFVPSYQAAIQVRERKVGWLYARTGRCPTSSSLLESLQRSGQVEHHGAVWEEWENWFRGVLETHSISPILAYVPAVYRGTSWVGAAAAVLDATSLVVSCLEEKHTESARICRGTGVAALKLIAIEINPRIPENAWTNATVDPKLIARFDQLYDKLGEIGLPTLPDRDACRKTFVQLRAEYETSVRLLAESTLMPVEEPWILPHAHTEANHAPPTLA
ncbi:hypothetical protein K32_22550 [Kaistia sp. 32K]|uniref:hypothetical protein n=1 Tax=Kaistia sp. 32K TaxID=2795690 RepID=UPI001916041D|nr:hypothetical protein [Kaistia sp. 32K]BCP53638.1 hypothetical protein K32_22550 [Kaistia sp. 32K]